MLRSASQRTHKRTHGEAETDRGILILNAFCCMRYPRTGNRASSLAIAPESATSKYDPISAPPAARCTQRIGPDFRFTASSGVCARVHLNAHANTFRARLLCVRLCVRKSCDRVWGCYGVHPLLDQIALQTMVCGLQRHMDALQRHDGRRNPEVDDRCRWFARVCGTRGRSHATLRRRALA